MISSGAIVLKLMSDNLPAAPNKNFESLKKVDENGTEYWTARELMLVLGYANWQNFEEVIKIRYGNA